LLTYMIARELNIPEHTIHILALGVGLPLSDAHPPRNLLSYFSRQNLTLLISSSDRLFNPMVARILGEKQFLRIEYDHPGIYAPLDVSILKTTRRYATRSIFGHHFLRLFTFLYPYLQPKLQDFSR
jgi:hypothetical protein